jgi:CBS-domain-containing membrane protein
MIKIPVTDFMRQPPVSTGPETTLVELVAELQEKGVRTMSVVDDAGKLVGVVSETDLFIKEKGVPFSMEKVPTLLGQAIGEDEIDDIGVGKGITVSQVMTRDVVTIDASATLGDVAWLMHKKKLSLLPVIADGTLVGEIRRITVLRVIYGIPGGSLRP